MNWEGLLQQMPVRSPQPQPQQRWAPLDKMLSALRHGTQLPNIWPRSYYMIAYSSRAVEVIRQEQGLSPLDLYYVSDLHQLYGLDREKVIVILGPQYLHSQMFQSRNPDAVMDELYARFGKSLWVYEEPHRTRSEREYIRYREEVIRQMAYQGNDKIYIHSDRVADGIW